jgi:hypothetical protein
VAGEGGGGVSKKKKKKKKKTSRVSRVKSRSFWVPNPFHMGSCPHVTLHFSDFFIFTYGPPTGRGQIFFSLFRSDCALDTCPDQFWSIRNVSRPAGTSVFSFGFFGDFFNIFCLKNGLFCPFLPPATQPSELAAREVPFFYQGFHLDVLAAGSEVCQSMQFSVIFTLNAVSLQRYANRWPHPPVLAPSW